ncbi:MAG: hypothetical protein K8L97_20170 [Anaerolineae bacterium]|nr:hypothetical protein [Anaerolineae bacterium]
MTDAKVLFRDGVNAIRNEGDLAKGRKLLTESLRLNPNNDVAWLWISKTVSDTQKKLQCVERALQVNPENQQALDLQNKLQGTAKNGTAKTAVNGAKAATSTPTTKVESELETSELGNLLAKLGLNWGAQLAKLVWFVGTLFLVFVCFMAYQQAETADFSTKLVFGILALLPLCGGIYILGSFVLAFGQQMEIYEDGIAHIDGDKKRAFRWSDFTDLNYQHNVMVHRYYGIPIAKYTTYDLKLMADGKKLISLTKNYSRFEDAGRVILNYVVPLILERHYAAYKRGETVQYGNIEVNREGIKQGRKSISWREIDGWKVENNFIILDRRDSNKTVRFGIYGLINGIVMVALVDRITSR